MFRSCEGLQMPAAHERRSLLVSGAGVAYCDLREPMRVVPARNGPLCQPFHARDCRHRGLDAEDAEGPSQIVDERREAELGAHVFAEAPWLIHCLMVPKGCSTVSRRRARMSGLTFSRS
jgi:hypothetical protein